MKKQQILVVDDDRSIVRILRGYLEDAGFEVVVAYDGESALHALRYNQPDILLLDIMLPDRDGWEITRFVRSQPSLAATPIIMITARVDETDRVVGLELGADDYITKPFYPREVVARVRAVLRRLHYGNTPVAQRLVIGDVAIDMTSREVTVCRQPVELTPTEFNLLSVLMESPNHTITREALLEKALGYAYEGMGRTLDTHIRNLRHKIEPDPKSPTYIQTVYRIGYRLVEGKG